MIISEREKCTGCGMCVDLCGKNAITMIKDSHGFYYPNIDSERCISCGLCQKKCPVNNCFDQASTPQMVYAAWHKNKDIRKRSTSGGVFTALAEQVINNGGVVAGVKWNDDFQAVHFIAENMKDLSLFNGSKYVQSHADSVYLKVRAALSDNKIVLFSGTPCQNNALKLFLGRDYPNLYMIDLVCHGVPSEEVLSRYLAERTNNIDSIKHISFRAKKPFWDWGYVSIDFDNQQAYSALTNEDSYFAIFNIGYSLRESCHKCRYCNMNRYGDITLADFWGYRANSFKTRDYLKGTSLVMINSRKGETLFRKVQNTLVWSESTKEEALRGQQALKKPFPPPEEEVRNFWSDFEEGMSIDQLRDKYIGGVPLSPPKHLWLRRIFYRYRWLFKTNGKFKK